jgi:hypothetical protein
MSIDTVPGGESVLSHLAMVEEYCLLSKVMELSCCQQ